MNTSQNKSHTSPRNVNTKHLRSPITLEHTLEMLPPNAADLDGASEKPGVCVPEDRAENHVRRVGAFPRALSAIADWLKACRVTTVAMASTGVSWIPLFQGLEAQGFTGSLITARA